MNLIKIGTRDSVLALWQANFVAKKLENAGIETQIVPIKTTGDKRISETFAEIGGVGLFTKALETALQREEIDLAVHSAKDVPAAVDSDLPLLCFTERERPEDVLLSFNPALKLEAGKRFSIGTSSVRRKALLNYHYPEISVIMLRGNLQRRMEKLKTREYDALILAYAGVLRVGYERHVVQVLPTQTFTPPAGQGCLAVQITAQMPETQQKKLRHLLQDQQTGIAMRAERTFLRTLQGGCSIPSFAHASLHQNQLTFNAGLASPDGKILIRYTASGSPEDAAQIGEKIALKVLKNGGEKILEQIKAKNKQK